MVLFELLNVHEPEGSRVRIRQAHARSRATTCEGKRWCDPAMRESQKSAWRATVHGVTEGKTNGARPLKRLIQSKILTPIAGLMISKGLSKGGTISVDMKGGEFNFSVKKGKNGSFVSDGFMTEGSRV